jgi:hypothetical protein
MKQLTTYKAGQIVWPIRLRWGRIILTKDIGDIQF